MAAFRLFLLPFLEILRQALAEIVPNLFARSVFQVNLRVGLTFPTEILRQKILSLSCHNYTIFLNPWKGFRGSLKLVFLRGLRAVGPYPPLFIIYWRYFL
jgi:hypothetical protein